MSSQNIADMSRRSFVRGASMLVGAGAVASLTSYASQARAEEVAADEAQWDEEYDVVIAGAGLAGSTAAVAYALKAPEGTCLLIEKGDSELGSGNSPYSGGSVIYTDAEHQADAFEYWKALRGDYTTTPDDVLEVFTQYMATTVDFMKEAGAKEEDFTLFEPGKAHTFMEGDGEAEYSSDPITSCWPEYPEIETSTSVGRMIFSGEEMSTVSIFMHSAVVAHSDVITFKTGAALTGLVQDPESKAILGAIYNDGEKEIRVKATKGVIMCLGGFERNPEMLQDYLSIANGYHIAGPGNTGDGYRMCAEAGAAFWHMNSMAGTWNGAVMLDGSMHAPWFTLGRKYGITVGVNGRRYYMDVDYVVSQNWYDYQNGTADLTTTTACRHGHYNFGGEWPHMVLPKTSWFIFDEANLDNAVRGGVAVLTDGDPVEEGWAVKADTIEELAELIEVPVNELVQTVETWNECCDKGVDVQFYRAPDWQTKVEQGPFYAIKCEPEFINTDGGPVRNAKSQVLDRDGNPIPNLYSSGEFGSVWCNMYQGGGNLSECVQFSRIAVDTICGA